MKAFTNTKYTKSEAVELAKLHRTQDDYIRGTYGEATDDGGWKGCSVGCMAKGKHSDYPELFGVDTRIAYLSDKLFENIKNYKDWTVNLFESIKEGSDTTIAYYKFMHWMLADAEHGVARFNKHKSVTDIADLFLRESKGELIADSQWKSTAAAADAAAAWAVNFAAAADAAVAWAVNFAAAHAAAAAAWAVYAAAAAAAHSAHAAAADAAAHAAYAAAAAADAATDAKARKQHYEIMSKKLCYFLAGNE